MRALLFTSAFALCGCLDFDKLLSDCARGATCDAGTPVGGGGPGFCFPRARPDAGGQVCWENPLPQGNTLNAVWGRASDDVWAGGTAGTLMHWDGTRWSSSQGDVAFASGSDAIVSLAGEGTLVAAGVNNGRPARFSNGKWEPLLGATSANHVSVARGNIWILNSSEVGTYLSGIWSPSAVQEPELVAADPAGTGAWLLANDAGLRELRYCTPDSSESCPGGGALQQVLPTSAVGLAVLDDGRVAATGEDRLFHYLSSSGASTSPVMASFQPSGSSVLPDAGGVVVGPAYGVGLWFGGSWLAYQEWDRPVAPKDLFAAWAAPGLEGSWVVGEHGVQARVSDGGVAFSGSGSRATVSGLVERGTDLFAFTEAQEVLRRESGGTWVMVNQLDLTPYFVAPQPDGGVLVADNIGTVGVWTGADSTGAQQVPALGATTCLFVLDDGTAFAGNEAGDINRLDPGGSWTLDFHMPAPVRALHGYDAAHVWAVGDGTTFYQRSGLGTWTPLVQSGMPVITRLNAVWAEGAGGRVWAVGDDGTIARVEPGASMFTVEQTATRVNLYGVRARSADDVWAAGHFGELWHRGANGTWTPLMTGCGNALAQVHFGAGTDLWLAGEGGAILRYFP